MAWTSPRTWTTGELVTASIGNTHWRDQFLETAPAKVTTQGDTLYATAANTLARLAKGTAGQVLVMNPGATAPEWGSLALSNLLVNGGFEIWQRGAGAFTADGAYTADRWVMDEVGTDAFSVTREGTTKKTNSLYSLAAAFTLGDSGTSQIYQRLTISDGHHGLLGQAISLRLPVKLLAGVASAVKAFITTDGTGGTTTYSSVHGNNTDWEDLDVANLTVPSDATYIQIGLEFAQSCTAYLDNVMLRLATTATNFVPLTPAEEWARCWRYYRKLVALDGRAATHVGLGIAYSTTATIHPWDIKPPMAVAPTFTATASDWALSDGVAIVNCTNVAIAGGSVDGAELYGTVASGLTQYRSYYLVARSGADRTITLEANP